MNKKVLFIVEGLNDETNFFRKLFKCCYNKLDFKIYSYKTNIHVLAQELYHHYPDFDADNIDIRLVLASIEQEEDKKRLLLDTYSDIYLVFDFEPQDMNTHFDTINRMITYFDDSSSKGCLYINYPMMQSYKDFNTLPSYDFKDKFVTLSDVKKYKYRVSITSHYTDLNQYNYQIFYSIIVHHLKKSNYLLNGIYDLPNNYLS